MQKSKQRLNVRYISERVQEELRYISSCPITAVVAPMGYGKTTAVNWYLEGRVRTENAAVLRISIYSDSLAVFWKRVQNAFSFAGLPFLAEYDCPTDKGTAALVADELWRELAGEKPTYIFLDDFHLLRDGRAAAFLCTLAMALPDNVHLVVASRDRFLDGAQIVRLGGRLHRIGADQLRLNHTELSIYARKCGVALTDRQMDALLRSSEGWFSAIYLSLCSFAERGVLSDENSDIYQMFTSALIDPLAEDEQEFLAMMSLADEFTAEMARRITGRDDVETMLTGLTEQNAFVTRLPDSGAYRFHHMMKTCAGRVFSRLSSEMQRRTYDRYGAWYEQSGQYLQALAAYEQSGNPAGWLCVVAEDVGVQLASADPEDVLRGLAHCPDEALKAHPRALLVLMRRLFSWGKYGQMLALKELLLRAAAENNGLSDEDRGNLRGECDLILSFLAYNDIAGMSALHRSACRQMTRPAVSIRTYGSFTFGSPSVLEMFHREAGALDEEVRQMNESMPYYYRVTQEHGAGAELVMEAEAAYLRGDLQKARLLGSRARYVAEEKNQAYIAQCVRHLFLRCALLQEDAQPLPESADARSALLHRRDAMLLLTFDSATAYACALLGLPERVPAPFLTHELNGVNILNPAKPMMQMIENQVYLSQGEWEKVAERSDSLLEICGKMHYALVALHLHIQAAAAYAALRSRAQAMTELNAALKLAAPDGIVLPFAENYRWIRDLLDGAQGDPVLLARIRELGAEAEARRRALLARLSRPQAASDLTDRELVIARLAANRATNREIAAQLYLTEGTVKQYINKIYAKLQIEGDTRTKRQHLAALFLPEKEKN